MRKRSILLFLPFFVGLLLCFFFPMIYIFIYSFRESVFSSTFIGIDNYKFILVNEYFQRAFRNTFTFTLNAVALTMFLAIFVSILSMGFVKKIPFIRSFFIIPFLVPSSLLTSVWQSLFPTFSAFFSLTFLFVIKNIGINILLITSSLCEVPKEIIDSAKIDGTSTKKLMLSILLPSISPTLLLTFILTLASSSSISRESYLLYGNYPDKSVYMVHNFLNNHFEKLNYQYVSTGAMIYTLVIFSVAILAIKLERRFSYE